jgi:hypothetical protein
LTAANIGRRFQGKTTLGVWMIDGENGIERRAILDPRGLIRRRGAVVVRTKTKLRLAFDALAAGDVVEVVYSPIEPHAEAFEAFAGELLHWTQAYNDLEIGVLVDEATFYGALGARDPESRRATFMQVFKSCSLDRFHIVLTCHRPTDLATDVRALLNRWCIFRTTQEHDLEAIRKRCAAAVADEVQQLADRDFVKWDDDDGTYEVNRLHSMWAVTLTEPGAERSILVLQ